jgi:tetratricopeptide (TPR) repeat protein
LYFKEVPQWFYFLFIAWASLLFSNEDNREDPQKKNSQDLSYWDCSRSDILPPATVFPLPYSQVYLIDSYSLLFHPFLGQYDALYIEALKEIKNGDLAKAQRLLEDLIGASPRYTNAFIQLGYVYLWRNHLERSKEIFEQVLSNCPCNQYVIDGMSELAVLFERNEQQQQASLDLYRKLASCTPDSFEYRFGLGRVLSRTKNWSEAETVLLSCLKDFPEDSDVGLQLANLYFWQKRYDEAENLYKKYPERIESKEGLAKIAMAKQQYSEAKLYYAQLIQEQPNNLYALQNLARIYAIDLEFKKSKKIYEELVEKFPKHRSGWDELLEVKLHTDPVINYNLSYVEAKENDPSIKKPVVRDYYFDNNIIIFNPIFDSWRIDVKSFFSFQEEKSILPTNPGINFNAQLSGAGVFSHFLFAKFWKWDLFSNVKRAWNVGHTKFPFQNTTRVEPGSYLSYISDTQYFLLGGNVDSYVIKNFQKQVSQLLTLKSLEAMYRYTFPVRYSPELEGWFEETYYECQPKNRRESESASLRFLVPFLEKYFKVFYTFEHRHFHRLNQNYYSFLEQWRNTFGFNLFLKSERRQVSFDLLYWHRTQGTKDLYQPIGDFIYIAPWQFLKCNQIQGTLHFRINDLFKADISSGYYRDTLPYRAWNIQGNLFWVF